MMLPAPLEQLLTRLWQDFTRINPQAEAIHRLLEERGERVVNDHIAFRTFSDPRVDISVIARPFVAGGYESREQYHFEEKRLYAEHFEHPEPGTPKVFISQLKLEEFDAPLQERLKRLIDQIPRTVRDDPELCAAGRSWSVTYAEYEALLKQSEYAGWMAAFGFRANHFTVLVNELKSIPDLKELNERLKQAGFELNAQGGEIKGSPEEFLEQSSTLASKVDVEFSDGTHRIPGCYYEFAQRYPLPDGRLFSGFVAKSADKIFQSTDRR
jgi:hypothetical protein